MDISIECADAWWGKLEILTENFSVRMNLDSNENAQQYMNEANKFATEEQKKRYLADIEKFKEKFEEKEQNDDLDNSQISHEWNTEEILELVCKRANLITSLECFLSRSLISKLLPSDLLIF